MHSLPQHELVRLPQGTQRMCRILSNGDSGFPQHRARKELALSALWELLSSVHQSVSDIKEPGVMTWTVQAVGRGPDFDVSHKVREGAGGEGYF